LKLGFEIARRFHRRGISEVMAAVVTIAITLIAGAALFSYVNSQAGTSENSLGVANAANVNFLDERFVVADLGFGPGNPLSSSLSFWIYNNGEVGLQVQQVLLYDQGPVHSLYFNFTNGSGTCDQSYVNCAAAPSCGGQGATTSPTISGAMTLIPPQASAAQFTMTLPSGCYFTLNTTYYVVVTGLYGNVVVSDVCYSDMGCPT
jgi:flagellin-like protein